MAKIKIVKSPNVNPNAGTGSLRKGDQVDFALYNNQTYTGGNSDKYQIEPGPEDVRSSYPEVPRDKANVEVEKGEIIVDPDLGAIYKANGKKHYAGGTPIKAKEGSYVISDFVNTDPAVMGILGLDSTTDKKQTWAELASKKVDPKYFNQLSAIMRDKERQKPVDPYTFNSAKNKFPELQQIISKIALGNELTKARRGKASTIPKVAELAITTIHPMESEDSVDPMVEAKYGGYIPHVPMMQGGDEVEYKGKKFKKSITGDNLTPDHKPFSSDKTGDYYLRPGTSAKAGPARPGGSWTQRDTNKMIEYLQKGVSPEELVRRGYNSKEFFEPLKKYYKPATLEDGIFIPKGDRGEIVPIPFNINPGTPVDRPLPSPIELPKRPNELPSDKPQDKPLEFKKQGPADGVGYDWHNIASILDSMKADKVRFPWSAKTNPVYADPQLDDPNYNPLLSANRTNQDVAAQISDPTVARTVGSYNPGLINGLEQETARAHSLNLGTVNQFKMYNGQVANQYNANEQARLTRDYDNTIKTLDNADTAKRLRKQDTMNAVGHADNIRDQMRFLLAQNPQYGLSNRNNYSSDLAFLKGKSLEDSANTGVNPVDQIRQYHTLLTKELGYSTDQAASLLGKFFGDLDGSTKTTQTFKGNGTGQPINTRVQRTS